MNISILANRPPDPAAKGDQIDLYHKLNSLLGEGHQIHLILVSFKAIKYSHPNPLLSVETIRLSFFGVFLFMLQNIFNKRIPFQAALFFSRSAQRVLSQILIDISPDCIFINGSRLGLLALGNSYPLLTNFIDSLSLNFHRRALIEKNLFLKLFLKVEERRLFLYENYLAKNSIASWFVSNVDKKFLKLNSAFITPVGVDKVSSRTNLIREPNTIIFTGNMNYRPNLDAVYFFIENIWPLIKKGLPSVKFLIVGRMPPSSLSKYVKRHPSVYVLGEVVSLSEYLNKASVAVAPMVSGSGMQLKILESMRCGTPIVCTRLGIGDIQADRLSSIFIADTPGKFAESVISLLTNHDLWSTISNYNINYIHKHHSRAYINQLFLKQFSSINI